MRELLVNVRIWYDNPYIKTISMRDGTISMRGREWTEYIDDLDINILEFAQNNNIRMETPEPIIVNVIMPSLIMIILNILKSLTHNFETAKFKLTEGFIFLQKTVNYSTIKLTNDDIKCIYEHIRSDSRLKFKKN